MNVCIACEESSPCIFPDGRCPRCTTHIDDHPELINRPKRSNYAKALQLSCCKEFVGLFDDIYCSSCPGPIPLDFKGCWSCECHYPASSDTCPNCFLPSTPRRVTESDYRWHKTNNQTFSPLPSALAGEGLSFIRDGRGAK